jgi:hypothetical protein
MKRSRPLTSVAIAISTLFLFATVLEAKEFKLINDQSVPAATGKVDVSKDRNGNFRVKVEVYHLAKPTALTPAKQAYIVWLERRDNQPVALGALRVNDDLKGTLEATAPSLSDQFDVFITAEDDPNVQTPSEPHLLHTTVAL